MPSHHTVLCRYHYDPLDRLAGHASAGESDIRLFYQKSRLATQIQGALHRLILQFDDQLLAQQQSSGKAVETALLATDPQRSVLQSISSGQREASAYTAYGHLLMSSRPSSLLGFDGERCDPVTGHYLLGSGYRAFNPVLMRFNSADSLSPFGEGGLNAYAYCQGDPVNYRDSTGRIRVPGMAGHLTIRRIKFSITDPIKRLQSSVLKNPKPLTIKPTSGVATEAGERSVSTVSTPIAALPSAPQAGSPMPSRTISTGFSSTTDKAAAEGGSRLLYYDDDVLSSMSDSNYVSHIKGNMNAWRVHRKTFAALGKDVVNKEGRRYHGYMLKAFKGRFGRTLMRKTLSERLSQIRRSLKNLADQ